MKRVSELSPFRAPSEPCELYGKQARLGILDGQWGNDWILWADKRGGEMLLKASSWAEMLSLLNAKAENADYALAWGKAAQ